MFKGLYSRYQCTLLPFSRQQKLVPGGIGEFHEGCSTTWRGHSTPLPTEGHLKISCWVRLCKSQGSCLWLRNRWAEPSCAVLQTQHDQQVLLVGNAGSQTLAGMHFKSLLRISHWSQDFRLSRWERWVSFPLFLLDKLLNVFLCTGSQLKYKTGCCLRVYKLLNKRELL